MMYTHMGKPDLFLYKGRGGIIQKIDEINMEVRRVVFPPPFFFLLFFEPLSYNIIYNNLLVTPSPRSQLHYSSIHSDPRLDRPNFCPLAASADAAAACSGASYGAASLAAADALGYRSAGVVLYDFEWPTGRDVELGACLRLLMGRNHDNKIEFLGGKREAADADVYATAAREFDEESGGIFAERAGDVAHRSTLVHACRSSRVLWCVLILLRNFHQRHCRSNCFLIQVSRRQARFIPCSRRKTARSLLLQRRQQRSARKTPRIHAVARRAVVQAHI
jgi:hypothetical protein